MPNEEQQEQQAESVRDSLAAALKGDDEETTETTEASAETEEAETEETQEASNEETAETEEAAEEQPEPLDAPAHWALEHQEMFRGLDRKAQDFLLGRSKDMEAAHTKRSQEIAPLRQAAERWSPYLGQMGQTAEMVFDQLMQVEYGLRTGTPQQKAAIINKVATDYGIDLRGLFAPRDNGKPSAEEDPFGVHDKVQAGLQPLQQQMQQVMQAVGGFQQHQQGQAQQQQASLVQEVQSFAEAKGEDGKPSHPYFDEVREEMAALAQAAATAGQPADLQGLYERACWSNPSVRAKMQAATEHAAKQQQRKAEQERAKKARAAKGSLAGSGGGGAKEQPKGRRAAIEAAWDEHQQASA